MLNDGTRERLLTTSAAARLVDRSESYIRKLADTGKLRAQRTASGVRVYERADVDHLARELAGGAAR